MKVTPSKFIEEIKEPMEKLRKELSEKYDFVSVLVTDSIAKTYSVSKSQIIMREDTSFGSRGCVLKVEKAGAFTEFSFNDFSTEFMASIYEKLEEQFALLQSGSILGNICETSTYDIPFEEICEGSHSSEYEISPLEYGEEKLLERVKGIYQKVRAVDERIFDCNVRYEFQKMTKLYLSDKKELEQNLMWSAGMIQPLVQKGKETKFYYDTFSVLGGAELLEQMEKKAEEIGRTALDLLNTKSITPGLYDVICMPEVTGILAHEAFGHGVEMDMFVKDRALAKDYIGKQVASELVTMHDGGIAYPETGFYYFDDEGQMAKDTIVIEKGILKKGICDLQSAMSLGVTPTGNGRRESFERKAYTRMSNTFFEAGTSTLEEMIASISHGYLLECAMSGMEDPKNWGIQCMVNIAREIKDGKLTGEIYSPIVLTGYVPDVLKSISMVSNDLQLSGSGCCGKGYKEWVKVSDGGAAVKAKVQLS